MQKFILLLISLLFRNTSSLLAYLPPAGPVFDRTAFSISLSADRCFRDLRYDGSDSNLNAIFRDRQEHEDPMVGWGFGCSVRKQPSLHWVFETGLYYAVRGYQYRSSDRTFGPSIDTAYVTMSNVTQALDEILIRHRFAWLEMPLRVAYQLSENRLRYHVSAGIAIGLPIGSALSTRYKFSNGEREVKRTDLPDDGASLSLMPMVSAGIEFFYTHRLRFLFEPTYRIALTDLHDHPVRERLKSLGLTFGLIYRYR